MSKKHKRRSHHHRFEARAVQSARESSPLAAQQIVLTEGLSFNIRTNSSQPDITHELKRIGLTFSILLALLLVAWYISKHTTYFTELESYLTRILHVE